MMYIMYFSGEKNRKTVCVCVCVCCCFCLVASVMSNSVRPYRLQPARLLSMGFSRQEYWSGWPYPPPGDLPDPGIKPWSPALQADSLQLRHQRSPYICIHTYIHTYMYVYMERERKRTMEQMQRTVQIW